MKPALLASLALLAAMAWPLACGRVHTHDDLGGFHLPVRAFYADRLAHGEPWDWMPQLFGGFYLTGEGQLGAYHPLHLVLYRWLPLGVAFELELVLSYPLMLAGAWLWLRRRLGRSAAVLFGAAVWTFCSFNLLRFVHPNAVAVTAHVPWLLWAIDVAATGARPRVRMLAGVAVALLTGSQLLLGYPQYVWFSLLAEAAWALLLLWKRESGRAFSVVLTLVGAKLLGLLLGAVQVLPTLDLLAHSTRAQPVPASVEVGAVCPLDLAQVVGPYLFLGRAFQFPAHEFPLYFGAVPLVLVAWLYSRRARWGLLRPWILTASVVAAVTLVLAFGRAGLLARLSQFIPLVSGFRCPCRYLVLTHLAVAGLAAMALLRLAQASVRPPRRDPLKTLWAVLAVSLLVAIAALALRHRLPIAPTKYVLAGPLLLALAAWLVARAERGARWAVTALMLLALGDLGVYGFGYAIGRHTHPLAEFIALAANPPTPGPAGQAMGADLYPDQPTLAAENAIVLAGWRRMDGYAGLEPLRRLDYRRIESLRAVGVHWVRANKRTGQIAGLVDRGHGWLEVPGPVARIRMVVQVRTSQAPGADITGIPLETTALVEEDLRLPPAKAGTYSIVAQRPGRLELDTVCSTGQLLVVAEGFDSGWQATAQGHSRKVLRANGDLLGCLLLPGDSRVVLEFRPRSLLAGRLITCLGIALVAVWLLVSISAGGGDFVGWVGCNNPIGRYIGRGQTG
jgi:hypothetical protein